MSAIHRLALLLIGSAIVLAQQPANAATTPLESLERIASVAVTHAQDLATALAPADATVNVKAGRLDSRLRLPACAVEPESFSNPGQTGMPSSVGVRCPSGAAWSLYVPVQVQVIADVVVLTTPISRGDQLTRDQVRLEPRDIGRMSSSYLTDTAEVEGMVATRQAQLGTVVNSSILERERIIRRGEHVQVSVMSSTLAVAMEGEALADAARGDRVKVRNLASGRVIEGTVSGAGLVVIGR